MNKELNIIGLSVRTNNSDGKAAIDIPALWTRFYTEEVQNAIPNKSSQDIYAIYTDYESNYKGDYTCIIGFNVTDLVNVPDGFVGRKFEPQASKKYLAKGDMPMAVLDVWNDIWKKDVSLNRSYLYDYELYTDRAWAKDVQEVDVFIGVKAK